MHGKGQNNEYLLNYNRSLIVQYLQRNKLCTRSQLSSVLGLTPASITKTVAGLMDCGLIEEKGFMLGKKGRRSIGITLKADPYRIVGAKLSRRNFSVGLFDFNGESYGIHSETFEEMEDLTNVLSRIKGEIAKLLRTNSDVVAIGIAVPGPYLEKEACIIQVTQTNNWNSVNLRDYFTDVFEVPVIIRHDANSGALAEWWFGALGQHPGETLIHFLVGEGVGAGVAVDGQVFAGDNGVAGEIGHVSIDVNGPRCACGNYGCLEMYCSSIAFVRHAKEQMKQQPQSLLHLYPKITSQNIFDAATQGDSLAVELVKRAARYIGYGVVTLINSYDPSIIVISNDMAGGGMLLLEEVRRTVRQRVSPHLFQKVSIRLSKFPNDPVLFGAAAIGIDYCLKNPDVLIKRHRTEDGEPPLSSVG